VDLLPTFTRQAWDQETGNHWRTDLRRIAELDLRRIITCGQLQNSVAEATQQTPPAEVVREFIQQRLGHVFPLLCPRFEQKG
jgi:hypothetical protein